MKTTEEAPGANHYFDYDAKSELTPLRFSGEGPPGVELVRPDAPGGQINPASSLDIDDKGFADMPARRQNAENAP